MTETTDGHTRSLRVRLARWIGFSIGLLLFVAAIWMALEQGASEAWDAVQAAPPLLFIAAAACTVLTLLQTSLSFWILTLRYGRVGYGEMMALITSAWLLNYLPMRPGLFGRVAYHKRVNNIRLRDSAIVLIWANVLSVICAIGLGGLLVGLSLITDGGSPLLVTLTALPLPFVVAFAAYARAKQPEPDPDVWRLIAGAASRYAELFGWAARYWICFAIIDQPISWGGALAVASVTTVATMVPLFGNGLGMREWTVGLLAMWLPAGLALGGSPDAAVGVTADLVNRAIEIAVAIPLGTVAAIWLVRRRQRPHAAPVDDAEVDPPV